MVAWCFIRFYPISRSWGVSPKKTNVEGCPDIATGGMVKGNPIAVMETSMGEIEAEYLGGKSHQWTKSLLSPSGLILQHLAVEKPWPIAMTRKGPIMFWFPEIRVPQIIYFHGNFHYKPTIFDTPNLWRPPMLSV